MSGNGDIPPSRVRRLVRGSLALAGVLLIGVLTNALWEFFLRDLLTSAGTLLLGAVSTLWSGYLDVIHRHIGELRTDTLMILPYSFFIALMLVGPVAVNVLLWKMYQRLKRLNKVGGQSQRSPPDTEPSWVKPALYIVTAAVIVFTLNTLLDVAESGYSRSASVWAERSIEIVAPSIPPDERLVLRSELRAVQSAVQFYAVYEHLQAIAKRTRVSLPPFSPIGYSKKSYRVLYEGQWPTKSPHSRRA